MQKCKRVNIVAKSARVQLSKRVAEADGNRTRLTEILGHVGVEDRGGHQAPRHLHREMLGTVHEAPLLGQGTP